MFNNSVYQKLENIFPKERILLNEPMKNHTTFRIGGNSDCFIIISEIQELKDVISIGKEYNIPITVIGNGSNILVKDGGIRGITLKINLKNITKQNEEDGITYTCGSGLTLTEVANIALEDEMTGLEFAYGIPGSIGGAIYMNAGAYGGEMKDVIVETSYLDKEGNLHTINNIEHEFTYRDSIFHRIESIIIECKIKLKRGNKNEIKQKMQENMQSRKDKQPLELPNAGSTFKRGENFIAAKLIDECGLKGCKIGDAEVSTKHAGFIVNNGNATAKDVQELIEYIIKTVKEKTGFEIQREILIIGE